MDNLFELKTQKALIAKNTKSCRDFINQIIDDKSFVEMDAFLFTQNELLTDDTVSEGVVSGYGTIDSQPVYIYCQNYDILKGGLGKSGANKILKCMNAAHKSGFPLISILHTQGTRLGEGITALDGYAEIIAKSVELKGVIPQIAVVKGECFGHMSYLAATNDFVYMLGDSSIVSGAPSVIAAKSNSTMSPKEIGGVKSQTEYTGLCAVSVKNVQEARNHIIKLLDLLLIDQKECKDDLNRLIKTVKYDGKKLVEEIFDKGDALEVFSGYANVFTYFGRLGGNTVGVIASGKEETLKTRDIKKITRFISLCDMYAIPMITLVDIKGINPCIECEQRGFVQEIAKLFATVADSCIEKISVICGQAIGIGYTALASKKTGFDYCIAWEDSVISPISSNVGAATAFASELKDAKNSAKVREKLEKKFEQINSSPVLAAADGCVDNIIPAAHTRAYLISTLQMLF